MDQLRGGLTVKQLKKIWAVARERGLGEVGVHQVVAEVTQKMSLRELTRGEGVAVIDRLVGQEGQRPVRRVVPFVRRGPLPPKVAVLVTAPQSDLIRDLLEQCSLHLEDPYFLGMLRRAIGREKILTSRDGSRVIDMLRGRLRAQARERRPVQGGPGASGCQTQRG
jgi:hypothetical protein